MILNIATRYSSHVLVIDYDSGYALLACTRPEADFPDPLDETRTFQEGERAAVIAEMKGEGFTPTEDSPIHDGGRMILPFMRTNAAEDMEQIMECFDALHATLDEHM